MKSNFSNPGKITLLLFSLILLFNSCQKVNTDPRLIPFAKNVRYPVCITHAGDSRLFVVGQDGYIYVLDNNGEVKSEPFLDIHERVTYGGERGLLGLAFDPKFKENGFFYVNYVGIGDTSHISRFSVQKTNPDLAEPGSEVILLSVRQPYPNHNGGDLCFGPDGFLYIGFGDGGDAGDPQNRAQNPAVLLGKMLRIDVSGGTPYSIPPSNPFVDRPGYRGEIWATGLRNPWRFSFDRVTKDLWIADVGQNKVEEIDFQAFDSKGGENYGWRCFEGNDPYNQDSCNETKSFVFPVHTYPHGPECSITGGYVYRGNESSPYYGHYFFADYCSDKVWTLHKTAGTWVVEEFGRFEGNNFCTFGEDLNGELYVAGLKSETIYKMNLSQVKK